MQPETATEARRWLDQAVEDLGAARHLANDPDVPARLAAFLAHLAAEKALKGTLIARDIAVRKIHDLVALQASLPPGDALVVASTDVDLLTPWNIEGRYPAAEVASDDAKLATSTVNAAERIVTALRRAVIGADDAQGA